MIYPEVKLDSWLKKYDLKIEIEQCRLCKKEYKLNIPFLMKGYAGLEMEQHGCFTMGKGSPFLTTPIDADEIEFWRSVMGVGGSDE